MIRSAVATRGYPPSLREIGEAVGLTSPSSVAHQLAALERKGYLRRDPNRPRAMEVVSPDSGAATRGYRGNAVSALSESQHDETGSGDERPTPSYVPVVGRIAAGGPILAEQAVEDVFPLPRQIVGDGELFLLKVVGDSMIEAGILDGDYALIRKADTARDGEIVVALVRGEEATLKYLRREGAQIRLDPANASYEPQYYAPNEVMIQGKLAGLLRRYH